MARVLKDGRFPCHYAGTLFSVKFEALDRMADPLGREKEDGVVDADHGEAGEKNGSGSETEEHLAGLNDTNVSSISLRTAVQKC